MKLTLLTLISGTNEVLTKPSRVYARYLMAHVTPSQRWGVPAGAPKRMTVHVKNGWLLYPRRDWEINSIGTFTNPHRAYLIVVLTYRNPSMAYGIDTILVPGMAGSGRVRGAEAGFLHDLGELTGLAAENSPKHVKSPRKTPDRCRF